MDTCRKIVSDVVSSLRAENVDDRIPTRLVLSTLKDKVRMFIKQDADSRRLFRISEIWGRLKCIDMKEIDFRECGFDIPQCNLMMRSCHKLPEVFQTAYGNILKIFTIDGRKALVSTTLDFYKDILLREFTDPNVKYFFLLDGYLYLPDCEVDAVMGYGLFKNPEEVAKFNGETCVFPLDLPFPCPDYLLDPVKKDTKVDLLKIFKPIVVDEKANLDTNEKN
jgi:hypothetical protein